LADFDVGKPLGRGKYGTVQQLGKNLLHVGHVYLAREKKSKFVVALKVLYKKDIAKDSAEKSVRREIEIMSNVRDKFYRFYAI
jgi:serine/threonine protein kinase